jgi:ABC-type sugar transport system permease subunit
VSEKLSILTAIFTFCSAGVLTSLGSWSAIVILSALRKSNRTGIFTHYVPLFCLYVWFRFIFQPGGQVSRNMLTNIIHLMGFIPLCPGYNGKKKKLISQHKYIL